MVMTITEYDEDGEKVTVNLSGVTVEVADETLISGLDYEVDNAVGKKTITLVKGYLNTLPEGEHEVKVTLANEKEGTTTVTVNKLEEEGLELTFEDPDKAKFTAEQSEDLVIIVEEFDALGHKFDANVNGATVAYDGEDLRVGATRDFTIQKDDSKITLYIDRACQSAKIRARHIVGGIPTEQGLANHS